MNYATASGDTGGLRRISAANCNPCNRIIRKIRTVHEAGGYFKGKGWSVLAVKYQPFQPKLLPVLLVTVRIAPQEFVSRVGGIPVKYEGGVRNRTFRLRYGNHGWRIISLERSL